MSKKKKKKEPQASSAAETVVEKDEQEESSETDAASSDNEEAADAHGDEGHGHGGHDPLEDDRPRNGLIAFITLITCIVLISFVIFVRELFKSWGEEELQRKVYTVQSEQLKDLRATEKQKLSKYQWVSQKDGVVRIPTDRAMELVIAAYRNPPPAAPTPTIETPTPKPEEIKPEEKKGEEGKDGKKDEKKDDKGKKDEKKGGGK